MIEPRIEWHPPTDARRQRQRCADEFAFLTRWDAAPFETEPTDCFVRGAEYEIWQPGVGGIRFSAGDPVARAFPDHAADPAWFTRVVTRSWMPPVYQIWGRQVLHASAAARDATGQTIVFTGPSEAGKSTLAYSLARRAGWTQVADDTLAFSVGENGVLSLHPLPNDARLRADTAAYHGRPDRAAEAVPWPAAPLRLQHVYVLDPSADGGAAIAIEPLTPADGYTRLLEQAHAFTLGVPDLNRRLMRDYLALSAAVPVCRLRYPRSFERLPELLDRLDTHTA